MRDKDHEGLETYLLYLILGYKPFIVVSGLLLMIYGVFVFSISIAAGSIALAFAILLLLVSFNFHAALILAKLGAWIGKIIQKEE